MRINDHIAFYHWVTSQGLVNLCPEVSSFVQCIQEYQRMCNCDPVAARQAKNQQCRTLYSNFLSKTGQFTNELLMKSSDNSLTFCIDGQAVSTISR